MSVSLIILLNGFAIILIKLLLIMGVFLLNIKLILKALLINGRNSEPLTRVILENCKINISKFNKYKRSSIMSKVLSITPKRFYAKVNKKIFDSDEIEIMIQKLEILTEHCMSIFLLQKLLNK